MARLLVAAPLLLLLTNALFCTQVDAASNTTINGEVSPGNSPGCIIDHGNVTLSSAATLLIELAGTNACNEYDRFTVQQILTIEGATLEVIFLDGYQPTGGEHFTILEWGTLIGTFGTINLSGAPLGPGLEWDISSIGETGEIVVTLTASATVPVPPWAISLGFVLFAALGARSPILANT